MDLFRESRSSFPSEVRAGHVLNYGNIGTKMNGNITLNKIMIKHKYITYYNDCNINDINMVLLAPYEKSNRTLSRHGTFVLPY